MFFSIMFLVSYGARHGSQRYRLLVTSRRAWMHEGFISGTLMCVSCNAGYGLDAADGSYSPEQVVSHPPTRSYIVTWRSRLYKTHELVNRLCRAAPAWVESAYVLTDFCPTRHIAAIQP